MSQWFYAEGNRERRGPLPAQNIVELFRSGRIAADTLVWREGAENWQPLQAFATELGLDLDVAPAVAPAPEAPAIPPIPTPPPVQHVHLKAPPSGGKQGLSGCAIAGIVIAAVGGVLLILIVILAAIALPAYQDYTMRSKTAMAKAQLAPLKSDVAGFVASHDRCPVNDDDGFGSPESYADGVIGSVRIGRYETGHCGVEARLQAPDASQLDGKALWLDYDTQTASWECRSNVADKYLPADCRR